MDLIRIDDNKMKIMLTPRDMQCYALDADTMDYTRSETRKAFRHILDDVCVRTGFDAKGDQIYVQLYPSREGGCEMFVTKLDMVCAYHDSADHAHTNAHGRSSVEVRERALPSTEVERVRTAAFSFDALEHLLCVCRRLHDRCYNGQSAAYRGEEGRYYLLLSERGYGRHMLISGRSALSFIHEYGTPQNAEAVRLYIREHARPICEQDAVARLSSL